MLSVVMLSVVATFIQLADTWSRCSTSQGLPATCTIKVKTF
jgi:hypothetical protein